ncbi:MAG: nucleoside deaminase [Chitinispirillaceae bacterium]
MNPHYFMTKAFQEALKALDEGEVPVGAVVEKNGTIVGRGYNRVESLKDATAHAEIIAITAAANRLSDWRLSGCTLYVTLEPCLMCLGALMQSRVDSIVYAAKDPRAGAVDSFFYRQEIERSYGYFPQVSGGVMEQESRGLLSTFFQKLRKGGQKDEML